MSKPIRKQIVEISKLLYQKGMANAFEGNVSVLKDDRIYITPSGVCKGFLAEKMIVVTDREGNVLEGGGNRPSSEIKMHMAAYRNRKGIASVIHAHPPYATAFALANKPLETKAYPETIAHFGKIPLAEYGTPSTDEIYKGMEKLIGDYDIMLLANHGALSVGKDVYDAYFKMECIESTANVFFLTAQLGGEKALPDDKLQELYELGRQMKKLKAERGL